MLTAAQYASANKTFLELVTQFFPACAINPIFVPLQRHLFLHGDELKLPVPPAAAAGVGAGAAVAAEAKVRAASPARSAPADAPALDHLPRLPMPRINMDAGLDVKEFDAEVKREHSMQQELQAWFVDEKDGAISWDLHPEDLWKKLESTFPLLAKLARRFLCIQATSAASERVWSDIGGIIGPHSAHIDSILAAQIAFLRHNKEIRARIRPSLPGDEE